MSGPGRAVLALIAAGYELIRAGRCKDACGRFEAALQGLAEGGDAAAGGLMRLDLAAALGEALVECDRLDEADRILKQARGLLDRLAAQGASIPALTEARLLLAGAHIRIWRREPAAALAPLNEALGLLRAGAVGPNALSVDCHRTLAVALGMSGRHDEATRHNRAALALLDGPELRHLGRERSRVLTNLGIADWTQGRYADARDRCLDALAILQGLVDAGDRARWSDIARLRMNLGGVLTSLNEHEAATASYRQAVEIYTAQIRNTRRSGANPTRLRASLASTRMNLGYAHFRAGRNDEAGACLRRALRDYEHITAAAPHLHDDAARTRVNHAHLLHRQGRLDAARRGYALSIRAFARLIGEGRRHLEADLANARLGMARVLASQRHAVASTRQCETALRCLAALTRQGQLHHARAWLQGLRGVADSLLASGAASSGLPRLQACLADPPLRGHPVGSEQIDDLLDAIAAVVAWRRDGCAARAELQAFVAAILRHLLGWTAALLGESDPAWLQVHAAALSAAVERLREAAAQDGAELLADWFLSTRGLRAQRNALAQSGDPRVRELAGLLQRLRRIEEELLGASHDPVVGSGDDLRLSVMASAAPPAPQRSAEWCNLHQRCDALRRQLAAERLVPTQLRIEALALARRLGDGEALFLLARPAADRAVVIGVQRPGANAGWAWAIEVPLGAELARFRCGELITLLRQGVVAGARGGGLRRAADAPPAADPAREELAEIAASALRTLAHTIAARLHEQVQKRGLRRVTLVPSDDLHLLPWGSALDSALAVVIYPSVGAWLQHRDAGRAPSGRWAVAAWPAAGNADALPWVDVERTLCRCLWRAAATIDAAHRGAEGVDAFVGMGHGRTEQHNPARAGVEIEAGEVVTAHDLPAIRTCRAVVLSCCVLGQTQEVFGEPLGFLSAAFGYDAGFGSGWLIEVPDALACLFGAAFQFALHEDEAVAWRLSFEATRSGIAQGRWPQGFGGWLAQQLPQAAAGIVAADQVAALIAGGALYRTPPERLRRLMPWVTCLGG